MGKSRMKRLNIIFILITVYWIAMWLRLFTSLHIVIPIMCFCALMPLIIIYILAQTKKSLTKINLLILAILLVNLYAIVSILYNQNHTIADSVLLFVYSFIGIVLYFCNIKELEYFHKFVILTFYYIIISVLVVYIKNGCQIADIYIAPRVGSNTISILLMHLLALDLFYRNKKNIRINFLYFLLACITSIIAGGIMGILTSLILFIAIIFVELDKTKRNILLLSCIYIVCVSLCFFTPFEALKKFISLGDSSTRLILWNMYYQSLDTLADFLFGRHISEYYTPILYYHKNMHNTIINWHYYFGLIPMLFFTSAMFFCFISLAKHRERYYLILITVTFLRAMTDETSYAFIMVWMYLYCHVIFEGQNKGLYLTRFSCNTNEIKY